MKNVLMVCIFLTAIGVFFPWYFSSYSVMGIKASKSISGFNYFSYGINVFILSIGSLVISFIKTVKKYRIYSMILSLIFSIIPFFHHPVNFGYRPMYETSSTGFGWGLYMTFVFALSSVITIYLNDYKKVSK